MPYVDWLPIIHTIWRMYENVTATNNHVLTCFLRSVHDELEDRALEEVHIDCDITRTIAQIVVPETHDGLRDVAK